MIKEFSDHRHPPLPTLTALPKYDPPARVASDDNVFGTTEGAYLTKHDLIVVCVLQTQQVHQETVVDLITGFRTRSSEADLATEKTLIFQEESVLKMREKFKQISSL